MGNSVSCQSMLVRSGRAAEYPRADRSDFCLLQYRKESRFEQMPPDHRAINWGSWNENRPLLDWRYASSTGDRQAGCTKAHTSPECSRLKACSSRSEEHTSELQSQFHLVCRLLLEKKKIRKKDID